MSVVTEAIEEAYVALPNGVRIIETLELDNIAFAQPIRAANNVDEPILLPLEEGGAPVEFINVPFSFTLPGTGPEGPSGISMKISDVQGELTQYFELAAETDEPISIIYRAYSSNDLSEPGDVYTKMYLVDIVQDAEGATGEITFKEIDRQAFPRLIYDENTYPTIQQL